MLQSLNILFSGFQIDEEKGYRIFGDFVKYVSDLPDLKRRNSSSDSIRSEDVDWMYIADDDSSGFIIF